MLAKIVVDVLATCPVCETPNPRTEGEIRFRIERLAKAGHVPSQYSLACCIRDGLYGLPRDPAASLKWLEKAAEGGHTGALAGMGTMFYHGMPGTTVRQSYADARRCYELGGNHAKALVGLSDLYKRGQGVKQDRTKAFELARLSADQGEPCGLLTFGVWLLFEEGRLEEARAVFEKGAMSEQHINRYRRDVALCQLQLALLLDQRGKKREIPTTSFLWLYSGLDAQSTMEMKKQPPCSRRLSLVRIPNATTV